MKKLLLLTALFCASLLCGCKEDSDPAPGSLYLYETAVRVDAGAGAHSLTLFSTSAWSAEPDSWITLDPGSAESKGIRVVRLNFEQNTTGAERTGTVLFRAGTYTETFTITQKAN